MPVMRLTREISTKGALWKPLVEKQVDDRGVGMIGSVDRLFSILNERPHVTLIWEINGVCKKCNQEHLQQQTHNCLVSIKDLVLNDFQMSCDNLFEPEKIACPFYPMENNDGKSMHIAIKRSFSPQFICIVFDAMKNIMASSLKKIQWHTFLQFISATGKTYELIRTINMPVSIILLVSS